MQKLATPLVFPPSHVTTFDAQGRVTCVKLVGYKLPVPKPLWRKLACALYRAFRG